MFSIVLEDLLSALNMASELQISVLPDSMKDAIVSALYQLKGEVATLAFNHFSVNEFSFEQNDQVFSIMREVVKGHYLGGAD